MKKKIILIIIVVVIILILIAAIILIKKDNSTLSPSPSDQVKVKEKTILEIEEKEKKQVDPIAILKSRLGLKARSFIERYGTYSSDNMDGNLKMLLPQMSAEFTQKITKKIELEEKDQGFVSLTTKVMNLTLKEFEEQGIISFIGQVQEQRIGTGQTELKQRIVEISFIKENDQWKVDDIIYNQ